MKGGRGDPHLGPPRRDRAGPILRPSAPAGRIFRALAPEPDDPGGRRHFSRTARPRGGGSAAPGAILTHDPTTVSAPGIAGESHREIQ